MKKETRPFYFIVVVWGEEYTKFLFDYCIASLLSPGNIPSLRNKGNKFIIATTIDDWEYMQTIPMFDLLSKYVEVVFIRIPPCPEKQFRCIHMGIGHKLATRMAYEDKAYAAILTPDLMVSDGTVANLQKHALNGIQVVLVAALRFAQEPLFENLWEINKPIHLGSKNEPIALSGRELVAAGINSFHSETLNYHWDSHSFSDFPVALIFRVPDEDAVIVHSLSWAPFLIDYAAIRHHDTRMLDNWTIDSDYIHRNFGMTGKVHVVVDSDEIMLVSWASLNDRPQPLDPKPHYTNPLVADWIKGRTLNKTIMSPGFDDLKRELVMKSVYWHSHDVNPEKFNAVGAKALNILHNQVFRRGKK